MPNNLDYGIIISIEHYKDMPKLGGPHKDGLDFQKWLMDPTGGDIPAANIGQFISTPTYTPIQDEIDDWFATLINNFQQNGIRGRRLYFYFSGHGVGITAFNAAMLLPKWTLILRSYSLSSEAYLLGMVEIGAFSEIFFFLDCCRNRIHGVGGALPRWGAPVPSTNSCEYLMYYASEFDNPAYELNLAPVDVSLNNRLPRGLFTKVLLDGLRGAAADKTGRLCVSDLVTYIKRTLPELAKSKGKTQFPRPRIEIDLDKELTRPFPNTFNVVIKFLKKGLDMVLEDPDLKIVHSANSDLGEWRLTLNRGQHILRKLGENDGKKINIDGTALNFVYG
jgi:Caspase domain